MEKNENTKKVLNDAIELSVIEDTNPNQFYEERLRNVLELTEMSEYLTDTSCRLIYLLQNNGCTMCSADNIRRIGYDINSSVYNSVAVFLVQEKTDSIPTLPVDSDKKVIFRFISPMDAQSLDIHFVENLKMKFCNNTLQSFHVFN